jgi:hypothetical protein
MPFARFFTLELARSADPWFMELEIQGLNPTLTEMVMRGQLSAQRIASLVRLRDMVDGMAGSKYVSDAEAGALAEKYGALPDIRTWGDYFQTEIASLHFDKTQDEFDQVISTVRFDLIAAALIFDGKPPEFMTAVQAEALAAQGCGQPWTAEQEEAVHLDILRNYFVNMSLSTKALSAADRAWFEDFARCAEAV